MKDNLKKRKAHLNTGILFNRSFRMEMSSFYDAVIYGVITISEYTESQISLKHKNGSCVFLGEGLSCESYVEGVVCIRGVIGSVRFEGC